MKTLPIALSALLLASAISANAERSIPAPKIVRAQGHPRHVDFMAQSGKRADLRASIQRKGLDTAFTDWLRVNHPYVYKQATSAKSDKS